VTTVLFWASIAAQSFAISFAILAAIGWLRASQEDLEAIQTEGSDITSDLKLEIIAETLKGWHHRLSEQSRLNAIAARLTGIAALAQGVASALTIATADANYLVFISVGAIFVFACGVSLLLLGWMVDRRP
jgi:hypothetical protein